MDALPQIPDPAELKERPVGDSRWRNWPGWMARPASTVLLMLLTLVLGIAIGQGMTPSGGTALAQSSMVDRPEFATLESTWELIHAQWADPESIDDAALIFGAAKGMVDALGDQGHSGFLDPTMTAEMAAESEKSYVGIGVEVDSRCGVPVVMSTFKDSPARTAGMMPGDIIDEVDGVSTRNMDIDGLRDAILGNEGDALTVTVERPGQAEPLSLDLTRGTIERNPVTWQWLPDKTVHMRITAFEPGVNQLVRSALQTIRDEGAQHLILDLRGNPGGLVSEVIGVASQFLDEGSTIFKEQDRTGDAKSIRTVGRDGPALGMDVVVLIDGQSASGAEVLAAGLRDNGRATLVGETTFGTGTVLSTFDQKDGSSVILGTAFWLTPEGEHVWQQGVDPDTFVSMAPDEFPVRPEDDPNLTAEELATSNDAQLQAAFAAIETTAAQ